MKKRIYKTLAIFTLLIVLIIVFIIFPLFSRIKNNSEELIVQKEKLINLEAKIINLEKFKVLYANLGHFLEQVDDLFVDSRVPIEFINFLEKTSQESQIEIEILSVSDEKTENDSWPYLDFQVISSGSFSDFLRFLEKLENSSYLVEIKNISISKLAEEADFASDNVRVNSLIKVFVK